MIIVSGLARLFQSRIEAEYIAGLWSNAIIEDLAWTGVSSEAPYDEYTGPSWSWAGYNGVAVCRGAPLPEGRSWRDVAAIQGWHAESKDESNPLGEVKPGAWIKIHGPTTELKLSSIATTKHDIQIRRAGLLSHPRFCTLYSEDEAGTVACLDYARVKPSDEIHNWDLQVILLGGEGPRGSPLKYFHGLVIRRFKEEQIDEKWERFGSTIIFGFEGNKIMEDGKNWKTITLV